MTLPDDIELREELEIRLCINGCQQRTAGYNEAKQGKKGLDTDDMERMETIAVNEVMELIAIYRKKWEEEANILAFKIALHDVDFAERWEQPLAVVKEQMTRRIDILESDLQGENK